MAVLFSSSRNVIVVGHYSTRKHEKMTRLMVTVIRPVGQRYVHDLGAQPICSNSADMSSIDDTVKLPSKYRMLLRSSLTSIVDTKKDYSSLRRHEIVTGARCLIKISVTSMTLIGL